MQAGKKAHVDASGVGPSPRSQASPLEALSSGLLCKAVGPGADLVRLLQTPAWAGRSPQHRWQNGASPEATASSKQNGFLKPTFPPPGVEAAWTECALVGRAGSPEGGPACKGLLGGRLRVSSLPPLTPPTPPRPLRGPAGLAACHTAVGFTSVKAQSQLPV